MLMDHPHRFLSGPIHETEALCDDHLRIQQKLMFTIGVSFLETNHRPVGLDRTKPRSPEDVGSGRQERDLTSLKGAIVHGFAAKNIAGNKGRQEISDCLEMSKSYSLPLVLSRQEKNTQGYVLWR